MLTEPKQQAFVRENRILGQLKLTLHYERGAFMVSNQLPSVFEHYFIHRSKVLRNIKLLILH